MKVSLTQRRLALFALALFLAAKSSVAGTISFATPSPSSTSGLPVAAEADFTTGNGTVTVTLQNFEVNPTSAVQAISGLTFSIDGNQTTATLASSSGVERLIAGDGSYTDASSPSSTGWGLATSGSALNLDVLLPGAAGPSNLIIGAPASDGLYDAANGSIAGNGPHNPFLALLATFTLNVQGVTAQDTITSASFQFGTTDGSNIVNGVPITATPEPATALLAGFGALGFGIRRVFTRRREKRDSSNA